MLQLYGSISEEDCVATIKLIRYEGSKDEKRTLMTAQAPFTWRHFEAEIILLCVRWYLSV